MDKSSTIEEINKFLKGIHMGATVFKDYLEKAQSYKFQNELTNIIESFKRHEKAITKCIEDLGGHAAESVGIMGSMGEFFEKVKLLKANSDEEVLHHAVKAMEMGIEKGNKFIEENKDLDEKLMKEVKGVVKDYDNHLRKLKEFW